MASDNVSSQGSSDGQLRGGLRNNVNSEQDQVLENTSGLSLGDLASLIRGSADILEANSPRIVALVNKANQLGGSRN